MIRRLAIVAALGVLVVGCGDDVSTDSSEPSAKSNETPVDPTYANFRREIDGNRGINNEYEIDAEFPSGRTVCVSDSGTHLHGFYQLLDRNCSQADRTRDFQGGRGLSVWADYNAAQHSHEEAAEAYCGGDRAALKVSVSPDRGWVVSCHEPAGDGGEAFTVAFFAKERDSDLAFGPDGIRFLYTVSLQTDPDHREADIALFEEFLSKLELAGTRLEVDRAS